jgi:hypothetical protein
MKTASALLSGLVILTLLAGCSETQFADWMGAGKNAPDESSVRVNQSLAMPPDLQLRPPSNATVEEDGALNTTAAASQAATVPNPQVAATTAATPPTPTTTVAAPAPEQQDVYAKYGISKTNPDGTPKDKQLLYKELKDAQMAEKRRANPNYGTIMNIGNIFTDSDG